MRDLRVSLTDEHAACLAEIRRLLMTSTDTGTIGPALFLAHQALLQIAGGQVPLVSLDQMEEIQSLVRVELAKVGANIQDPTTDPEEARSVSITLKLTPYPDRAGAMMQVFSSVKVPKTTGPVSEVRFAPKVPDVEQSSAAGVRRPQQLKLSAGPDWIVATDGKTFEAHPCDWPLSQEVREDGTPVWSIAEGPMIRPEAEQRAAQLSGREAPMHTAYPGEPVIWQAKPGALPPVSPPASTANDDRGRTQRRRAGGSGEAGGRARKGKP